MHRNATGDRQTRCHYSQKWISPLVKGLELSGEAGAGPPKYLQVADHLRQLIVDGDLQPGDELPSERQLVQEWDISRPTATRALAVLRVDGLVEARQGSGTFVSARPRLSRRARDRYARSRRTGRVYTQGEHAEILSAEIVAAPDDVAAALELELGAKAIRRERLTLDGDEPVELSTSWFPATLEGVAPRLLDRTRIREGTLAYLERMTRRRGVTARDWVGARLASARERRALGLGDRPAAVLIVNHTVLDDNARPLEFVQAVHPPDRWTFEQEYPIPT